MSSLTHHFSLPTKNKEKYIVFLFYSFQSLNGISTFGINLASKLKSDQKVNDYEVPLPYSMHTLMFY